MKVNLRKIGAIVAGSAIFATSVAFAGLWFGNTQLVNDNGQPTAKVVVGEMAAASDGVAAANIAAKIASEAFKTSTLTAQIAGQAKCSVGASAGGAGTCSISNEKVQLEVTVPGATASGTYQIRTFVSEISDRTLEDRGLSTLSNYSLATAETSTESHPFTDGETTTSLAETQQGLFRLDGNAYSTFADVRTDDKDSGRTYTESQALFSRTENQYRESASTVQGRVRNFQYQVKFTQDSYGIPICTTSVNASWANCATTDTTYTGNHKVKISFLGSQWIITKLVGPGTTTNNETRVVAGGEVDLAKESVSGIINVGESLKTGVYTIRLDDIKSGTTASEQGAIVSLLDASGSVLKQTVVAPGNTVSLLTDASGQKVQVRVFKTAPGYTFGAKWADMSVISNELILRDADTPESNGDKTQNNNNSWKAKLMWKNRDTSSSPGGDNTTDHLRSIVLYRDGATDYLSKGTGITMLQTPQGYNFLYQGLDLNPSSSTDYDTLSIQSNDGSFTYTVDGQTSTSSSNASTYISVKSGIAGAFSTTQGTGNELRIPFFVGGTASSGGARGMNLTDGAVGFTTGDFATANRSLLLPGDVLLKLASGKWVPVGNTSGGDVLNISYTPSGASGSTTTGGALAFGYSHTRFSGDAVLGSINRTQVWDVVGPGKSNLTDQSAGSTGLFNGFNDSFIVALTEDSGENLAAQKPDTVALLYNVTAKSFNKDIGVYVKDKVLYYTASNYSALSYASGNSGFADSQFTTEGRSSSPSTRQVNFVTERGSIVTDKSDSSVTLKVARKPARVSFLLSPVTNATADPTKTQYTLSKGQTVTLANTNGITVKAVNITEDVGSCAVGAGAAPACTVDSTGQSAVIMPNNQASVVAGVPFGYSNFGTLVLLDKDAVGTDVLVTVGGPAVNKVTADALSGASVNFATDVKVVKEVVAGKKVVVAGLTASDTLSAASDFISQLKKQ